MTKAPNYPEWQKQQRQEAAPRRAEQEQELRGGNVDADREDQATLEDASDDIDRDGQPSQAAQLRQNAQQQEIEDEERAPARAVSPSDRIREEIASRFRRPDEKPFSGDINDPELIFGSVAEETLVDDDPDGAEPGVPDTDKPQEQAAPQKRTFMLKVNGLDVQMTEEEVLARAQKVAAADMYFDEAKDILKQAKQIRRQRSGADVEPDQFDDESSDDLDRQQQSQQHQDPDADLEGVVEAIQYKDPKEAAKALAEAIDKRSDRKADQRQLDRLLANDLVKSKQELVAFKEANAELAEDPNANAVIESAIYRGYREDILKLGIVPEDQLPKDARLLADWHRFYRVHGHQVRSTKELLEAAKSELNNFRGTSRAEARPAPRAQPRVDVNVNRTERRQAIPNQPSRAAIPQRSRQQDGPKPQDRSSAIREMRMQRGQPVG